MKNKILILLQSFFTIFSLSMLNVLPAYYIFSLIILIILCCFYSSVSNSITSNKKTNITYVIISLVFGIALSTGKILADNYYNIDFSLFRLKTIAKIVICSVGLTPLLFYSINYVIDKLPLKNKLKDKKMCIKYWFIFSLIIFISWVPYFLMNYPGIVSSDVIDQLGQFLGLKMLNSHHPVLHTLYIGSLYKLFSFGGSNFAIAATVVVQMVILSLIYGYSVYYLNTKGLSKVFTIIILIFYATPIFGIYSVNLWKDTIFSGLIVLLVISIMKICDKGKITSYVMFIAMSILSLFFRNNAIYMYMILIIFSLILMRKIWKKMIICFFVVLCTYVIVKGPIYSHYNIKNGSSAEYLAIPIQQVARMAKKDVNISNVDKKDINKIIDIKTIKEVYNPFTSDDIKFNNQFNIEAYDKNKIKYAKLWFKLVCKHPDISVESYLLSTIGYWYPNMNNYLEYDVIADNSLGIYYDPKMPSIFTKAFKILKNRSIPILSLEYSCSFAIYLIFISLMLCIHKKNKKYVLCYVPIIGLWISIMIATPVAAEFRYIFWSYTCLPILLFIPFRRK